MPSEGNIWPYRARDEREYGKRYATRSSIISISSDIIGVTIMIVEVDGADVKFILKFIYWFRPKSKRKQQLGIQRVD
jgi:hypothetical protein